MVPLFPIVVTVSVTAVGSLIVLLKTKRYNIGLVGPEEGGKTTFIEVLKKGFAEDKYRPRTNLQGEPVPEFPSFWSSDVKITVNKQHWRPRVKGGEDYLGQYENVQEKIGQILENNELIFFIFDVFRFVDDKKKREDCVDALDCMYREYQKLKSKKQIFLVGTHLNELRDKYGHNKFLECINNDHDKQRVDLGHYNLLKNTICIDLVDKNSGDEIRKKCFGKWGEKT